MIRIIPNKNNIGAEINTDIRKLSKQNFKTKIIFIIKPINIKIIN